MHSRPRRYGTVTKEAEIDRPSPVQPVRPVTLDSRLPSVAFALWGLAGCVFVAAMFAARDVIIPIVAAAVVAVIVAPIARLLVRRLRFSNTLAALAAFLFAVIMVLSLVLVAVPTVQRLAEEFPSLAYRVEYKLRSLALPIDTVKQWSKTVEEMASLGQENEEARQVVVREGGSTIGQLMSSAPQFVAQLVFMLVLVFYFVRERRALQRTIIATAPTGRSRRRISRVCRLVRQNAVSYLGAVTLINITLGIATAICFYLIGMPMPWAWGIAMAVLNYLPFIGPLILEVISFLAALIVFPTIEAALLPPAVLLALNVIESNFGMPLVMQQRFLTSPLATLIGIAFGAWLWGAAGAILAVPLVVMVATGSRAFYQNRETPPVRHAEVVGVSRSRRR